MAAKYVAAKRVAAMADLAETFPIPDILRTPQAEQKEAL
jgi:hypothetical protein